MAFFASAIVGAVTAIGGAAIASSGAKSAANAQVQAAQNATDAQLQMFNTSVGLSAPSRNLGFGAQTQLAKLFGINPATLTNTSYSTTPNSSNTANIPGSSSGAIINSSNGSWTPPTGQYDPTTGEMVLSGNPTSGMQYTVPGAQSPTTQASSDPSQNPDYSGFYNTPGFNFAKDLGLQAIQRQATAGGGLYSANTMTQQNQYATGFASQHYNDYVQQLLNMAGMGNGSANAAGQNAVQTGMGISNNAISQGNAQASGIAGQAGAWQGAIGGISNIAGQYYQNRGGSNYTVPQDISRNISTPVASIPTSFGS